jgi:GntR family transcriptional regulator, rspAB operon transcriptional repressor
VKRAAAENGGTRLPEEARIDRALPIGDQVYRILRHAIITLRLRPGAVVIEKDITDRLGISRTPVRDAVRLLAEERLLDVRPQFGTYVAHIDRQRFEEGHLIRRALESESIRLAIGHVDEAAIDHLRDLLLLQERAAARGRHEEFIACDDAFHKFIAELSGHDRLWEIVQRSKADLDRVRHLASTMPQEEARAIAEHRSIVGALSRRGGSDRAVKALTDHLDDAYKRSLAILEQHAEMVQ